MLHTDMSVRTPPLPPVQLRDAWAELHRREPELRARDLAERLGVSEGELLASRCGEGVTRLEGPWPALLQALITKASFTAVQAISSTPLAFNSSALST